MKQFRGKEAGEDLRQRRTRKHLMDALLALMEERPFQELSVVDICDRAMVHRTTFYAHFEDKYALLRYAVAELQREFESTMDPDGGATEARAYFLGIFRAALRFVRDHKRLYLSGLSGGGAELQMLEDVVSEQLLVWGDSLGLAAGADHRAAEAAAHFFAGAALAVIRWWLEGDMPVDDETLLRYVDRLVPVAWGDERG